MLKQFSPFDMSQIDPAMLAEISSLMQTLSPSQIMQLQSLIMQHHSGKDIQHELELFGKSLPADFIKKITALTMQNSTTAEVPKTSNVELSDPTASIEEARLTLLRAVSRGELSPEEAFELLFPNSSSQPVSYTS